MKRRLTKPSFDLLLLAALAALGVLVRVQLRDLPNFAPVAALALFAGYYTCSAWRAAWVPLVVMALSDLCIGGYPRELRGAAVMGTVYFALALPAFAGPWLRRRLPLDGGGVSAWCGVIGASLFGSVSFFLLSNFASWLCFGMYPHTAAGLLHCFVQAVPFFRATLVGDMTFALILFGGLALSLQLSRSRSASPAPSER